ncbi:conserved hypothetical protein [Enterobacterales bacterium 8AC]|nr:conserved hypothetical protein [Enterobacterales bacterium 8AC]
MRRKNIVIQSTCNFMRKGLEAAIRDTELSANLDILGTIDNLEACGGILSSQRSVNIIVLTLNNHDRNLASLLQLVGKRLSTLHPDCKVIIIGDIIHINLLKCYFSGLRNVSAILDKEVTIDELSKVLRGITANKARRTEKISALLSTRELQILKMLLEGDTATKIADSLQLNFRTVSHHKRAALAKLGVRSLSALADLQSVEKYNKKTSQLMRYNLKHNLKSV